MRKIQASDAKARLSELLDDVEQGRSIVITRHGRDIAHLVPAGERRKSEIGQAIERIKQLQKTTGKITLAEILSARDEGRKY